MKGRALAISHWKLTKKDKNSHARAMGWRVGNSAATIPNASSGGFGGGWVSNVSSDSDEVSHQSQGSGRSGRSGKTSKSSVAVPSFLAYFEPQKENNENGTEEEGYHSVKSIEKESGKADKASSSQEEQTSFLSHFDYEQEEVGEDVENIKSNDANYLKSHDNAPVIKPTADTKTGKADNNTVKKADNLNPSFLSQYEKEIEERTPLCQPQILPKRIRYL